MIYFTGSGVNPGTLPTLLAHPMIGVLTTPVSVTREYVAPFRAWAADNGCFSQGSRFNLPRYLGWLAAFPEEILSRCAFATAPDVVGDAQATWERSHPTFAPIRALGYDVALVAQDGLEDMDVQWGEFDALFLGGTTAWKLSSAARSCVKEAKRRGMWAHMGRVNSFRRLQIAHSMGCDSADGNFLKMAVTENIPRMFRWFDKLQKFQDLEELYGLPHKRDIFQPTGGRASGRRALGVRALPGVRDRNDLSYPM